MPRTKQTKRGGTKRAKGGARRAKRSSPRGNERTRKRKENENATEPLNPDNRTDSTLELAADSGAGEIIGTGSPDTWDYQPDPQVMDVLSEDQRSETTNDEAPRHLRSASANPELSGGDVDADWERAGSVGEETVGGSVVTPDQDRVDDLGRAWGVEHQDDEPIHTVDKIEQRDRDRQD